MKKSGKWLSVLLTMTIVIGSLCNPVYAALEPASPSAYINDAYNTASIALNEGTAIPDENDETSGMDASEGSLLDETNGMDASEGSLLDEANGMDASEGSLLDETNASPSEEESDDESEAEDEPTSENGDINDDESTVNQSGNVIGEESGTITEDKTIEEPVNDTDSSSSDISDRDRTVTQGVTDEREEATKDHEEVLQKPKSIDERSFVIDKERSFVSPDKLMYTGSELYPEIEIYAEGAGTDDPALLEGVDYKTAFYNLNTKSSDTVNAGIIEVTITGIGNCSGEIKGSYEIVPMDISLLQDPASQDMREENSDVGSPALQDEDRLTEDVNEKRDKDGEDEILTDEASSGTAHYNDTDDIAYLLIRLKKYSETYESSSCSDHIPQVAVLEKTSWSMEARFIEIREGKTVNNRNVTKQCLWKSTDTTGKTLSVDSNGKVTASQKSAKPYKIIAAYSAIVNGEHLSLTAQMDFSVKSLEIKEDKEGMRCLAFNYLLTEKWDYMQDHLRSWTVEQCALSMLENGDKPYFRQNPYDQSATLNHFLLAAARTYTPVSCLTGGDHLNAILFTSGTSQYLVLGYTNGREEDYIDGYSLLFQEGMSLFRNAFGSNNDKQVVVTGMGLGGTVAKYLAYTTGCKAITFNSKSALGFVSMNAFADLCIHYNPNNFLSYNYSDQKFDDGNYCRENYFRINRTSINISGISQMISYDANSESIGFSKTTSKTVRDLYQREWNRNFYLGDIGKEQPQMEPSITSNYASWVCFGGDGSDTLKLTENLLPGAQFAKNLRLVKLIADNYPGGTAQGVAKLFYDLSVNISEGEKLGKIMKNLTSNSISFLPGLGDVAGIASFTYDVGMMIYGNLYPENNIFVGGKGDDIMYGSPLTEWYIYSEGDGFDTIYDGKDCTIDNLFFLDISSDRVTFDLDSEQDNLLRIMIDEEPVINFYMEDGGVCLYFGSPFDNNLGSGMLISRNMIQDIMYKIRQDEVAMMNQAACPVDMLILDAEGNIVEELLDGTESFVENERGVFEVKKDGDEYIKTAVLYDRTCRVALRGTSEGEMLYAAICCDEKGRITQSCAVESIPVHAGDLFNVVDDFSKQILKVTLADGTAGEDVTYNTDLTLSAHELSLNLGDQVSLSVNYSTNSALKDFFWVTTDDTVVTVGKDGLVTATGAGEASIAAISLDGSYTLDTCRVTVSEIGLSTDSFIIQGLASPYTYTGKELEISLDVSCRGIPLEEGTDYELIFPELTGPGEYNITLNGLGRFEGTTVIPFEIINPPEAASVSEKVQQLVQLCRQEGITDEWETALWFHDWLTNNANYDYTYSYYMADGVLLHGRGVCNSYALAFQKLLNAAGIENDFVVSEPMNHAWNMVKLDGEWCHIDCTWDDPGTGGAENHSFFGMNDDLIAMDHEWTRSSYPVCTSMTNYYPLRKGIPVFSDKEQMFTCLSEQAQDRKEKLECFYIGTDPEFYLYDNFYDWFGRYNWKYGIQSYQYSQSGSHLLCAMPEYTDPWDPPAEFTGQAACPLFILRGPEGTYDLRNYYDNGIILIFGRSVCSNTQSLLSRLNSKVGELRSAGVEVFMNLENSKEPGDFDEIKQQYPNLAYTYEDTLLRQNLLSAVNFEKQYMTYPLVFFINKHAMITYFSEGYVNDIDAFIEEALATATGTPLPSPEPSDPSYDGTDFRYDGNDEALTAMVRDALSRKQTCIYAKDATWKGESADWDAWVLWNKLADAALSAKKFECDYKIEHICYYSFPYVYLYIDSYDAHSEIIDPAVSPTCTESGLTEGSHCKYCNVFIRRQSQISALGHDISYHEAKEGTGDTDGNLAYYSCRLCGRFFEDENGTKPLQRSPIIHDLIFHPAVAHSCDQDGTEAYYSCRHCGSLFSDETAISAIDGVPVVPAHHNLVYQESVQPTCETDGHIAFYYCKVCKEEYLDEYGRQKLTGEKTIPHSHDYQSWISNGNGTHNAVCSRNSSHKKTEDCCYSYTVLQERTGDTPEYGQYTCNQCGYSFNVYNRQAISSYSIELSQNTYTYDSYYKEPRVIIRGLSEGIDYYVSYENNCEAGKASAVVYGQGNYTGMMKIPFTILPVSLETADIQAQDQGYTGNPRKPVPTVLLDGKYLEAGRDFDLSYANNTSAGTATVIVNGKGNYKGKSCGTFSIVDYGKAPELALITDRGEAVTTTAQNGRAKVLLFFWTDGFASDNIISSLRGKSFAGVDFIFANIALSTTDQEKIITSIGSRWPSDVPGVYTVCNNNSNALRALEERSGIAEKNGYISCPTLFIIDKNNRIVYARHGYYEDVEMLVNSLVVDSSAPSTSKTDSVYTGNSPSNFQKAGLCGDRAIWRFYADGTLRIEGKGDLWHDIYSTTSLGWLNDNQEKESSYSNAVIYKKDVKKVVIGKEIGNPGAGMFTEFSNLKEIVFLGKAPNLSASPNLQKASFNTYKQLYQGYGLLPSVKTLTITYPSADSSWTALVRSTLQSLTYEGEIKWLPVDSKGIHTHTFGTWKTVKAATAQSEGIKERVCTTCGEKEKSAIAKLNQSASKKKNQSISGVKTVYNKTFGDKKFLLRAVASTTLTYLSSNTKVAKVDKNGKVTIKGSGTAKITIKAAASSKYNAAKKTVTIKIAKAKPTIKVKTPSKTFTFSAVKKKAQTYSPGFTVNSKGKLSFKKKSGSKNLTVNSKNGKVTIKKGTKKGSYKAAISVTSTAKGNYKKITKTINITIKVK